MTISASKILILIIAMSVAGALAAAACGGSVPKAVEIPVNVASEAMEPGTIRVKQGDMVTLKIDSEEAGEFHLHGYDIELEIDKDEVGNLYFVANATGRFGITFHHTEEAEDEKEDKEGDHGHDDEEENEGVDIGFLEVGPR